MIEPTLRIVRPAETDSDTAALARVAEGDLTALGELYTRHAPALLRFAKHAVGAQAAEDLVQATFIKAVERASTYDGRSTSARGWLYGIAGRLSQERRRALGRFARALSRLGAGREETAPPDHVERRDLVRGLAKLSDAKRVVLILAEIEGFTATEIAAMLEIPVGTVWTRLHHARRELRDYYEVTP